MTDTPDPDLLTPPQASAFIGVSTSTLARWRQEGRGPTFYRHAHNIVRYARIDLLAFLETRKQELSL